MNNQSSYLFANNHNNLNEVKWDTKIQVWVLAKKRINTYRNRNVKGDFYMSGWDYIREYEELNDEVRHRGQEFGMVQSILVAGSLLAVTFALRESQQIGSLFAFSTILVGVFFVLSAGFMAFTSRKLDFIFMERIKALEARIPIEFGYRGLGDRILNTWWYKLRKLTWVLVLTPLLVFYSFALILNFPGSLPQLNLEQIGILLAILSVIFAISIPVLFEQWKKPDLDIIHMDEKGAGADNFKFVHIKVLNKPHKFLRFIERNFANETRAKITFIDEPSGNNLFTMSCKWSGKPEPVTIIFDPNISGNAYVLDVTKIREAESVNIPPGKDGEVLDVALKHKGEKECYGFNAQNYAPIAQPKWRDPNKKINSLKCLLRVTVTSGETSKSKDFFLKNPGINLEDFICESI